MPLGRLILSNTKTGFGPYQTVSLHLILDIHHNMSGKMRVIVIFWALVLQDSHSHEFFLLHYA